MRWQRVRHDLVTEHTGTIEDNMEIPQKIKNTTTKKPSDPISGHLSKEHENTNLRRYM